MGACGLEGVKVKTDGCDDLRDDLYTALGGGEN